MNVRCCVVAAPVLLFVERSRRTARCARRQRRANRKYSYLFICLFAGCEVSWCVRRMTASAVPTSRFSCVFFSLSLSVFSLLISMLQYLHCHDYTSSMRVKWRLSRLSLILFVSFRRHSFPRAANELRWITRFNAEWEIALLIVIDVHFTSTRCKVPSLLTTF